MSRESMNTKGEKVSKKLLFTLVGFNIIFILIGGYALSEKGGIDYLKRKLNTQKESVNQKDHQKESVNQKDHNASYYTKKSIFEIMPNNTNEIIFVGNSITDGIDWYELFGKSNIKNRGIGGDVIAGVIDRLDEIVESNPKKIFLMIGTNDLSRKRSVDDILSDYEKLVNLLLVKLPETDLYLQSILPTKDKEKRKNSDIIDINKGIVEIAKRYSLTYVNLFDLLKTDNNELNMEFSYDGLHINGKGYLIWKNAIIKYVN
jgi:lysophospholipase L1-like esterase